MSELISWLKENPGAVASLSAAFISAAVAIIIASITQLALSRRNNRELITKKLEELYILLNEAALENGEQFKAVTRFFRKSDPPTSEEILELHTRRLELDKKIRMYVNLYFPGVSPNHQELFKAQSRYHVLLDKLISATPPNRDEFEALSIEIGKCFMDLEDKIIDNKLILAKKHL